MNITLFNAIVALVPTGMIFCGSVILFLRGRAVRNFLQILRAGCLLVVVLAHVSEALRLFPWMLWGRPDSVGHFVDLLSAVLGLTLFPIGYLLHALAKQRA
jgi:hypothetical protein